MSDQPNVLDGMSDGAPPRQMSAVQWLIAANVVVYLIQLTLLGGDTVADWLALSSPDFPAHWWTIGTYMFVHGGLMHLTLNMFMLWMFGPRIERAFGTRSFVYFYFWCGLGGAIFHLLFVQSGAVIGASGAVVGVVLAYALRWPDEELYVLGVIPMRARWLAVWMIVWNAGMALADMRGYTQGGTAWMTHVGGLAFAWLALHAPTSTSLNRMRWQVTTVPDDRDVRPIPKSRRRSRGTHPPTTDEVVARSNAIFQQHGNRPEKRSESGNEPRDPRESASHLPVAAAKHTPERLAAINRLLDKISREGMESLTIRERQLLEEMSRGV